MSFTLDAAEDWYRADGQDSPYLPADDAPRRLLARKLLDTLTTETQRHRDSTEEAEEETIENRKSKIENSPVLIPNPQSLIPCIEEVLRDVREMPLEEFAAANVAVALRPIRKAKLGALIEEVCETFYDYYRGRWAAKLSRPDHYTLRTALAATLSALPAQDITPYWEKLQFGTPLMRRALWMGLEFFRETRAAPSLLFGLTFCTDHAVKSAIVDHLEQIGDPQALPILHRLRRETATTDWTLSRHLARAIGVIERQNTGQNARTLLRPTAAQPDEATALLRPLTEETRAALDRQTLLRSRTSPETSENPSASNTP